MSQNNISLKVAKIMLYCDDNWDHDCKLSCARMDDQLLTENVQKQHAELFNNDELFEMISF